MWVWAKWKITSSFGIKPVRGGRPARDRRRNPRVAVIKGPRLNSEINCDLVEINIMTVNNGIATREYKMKYNMVTFGILIFNALIIHPEWVIDE